MRKKSLTTARNLFAALLLILFAVCLSAVIKFALPDVAHAEEDDAPAQSVETVNEWLYANVVGWDYNSFNTNINTFTAVPQYGDMAKNVKFELYKSGETDEDALYSFYTDGNGRVDTAAELFFNNLDAGDYYVTASIYNLDSSYGDISNKPVNIDFTVSPVENEWIITPSLISWKWGGFDANINKISAQAVIGNDEMYFMIYGLKDELVGGITSSENIVWLTYSESIDINGKADYNSFRLINGSMPDYVINALKSLDAGTYYLVATVPASADGNYSKSTSTSPFSVVGIDNSFTKLTIEQWTWSEFDYTKNIIEVDVEHGMGYDHEGNPVYDTDKYETIRNIKFSVYYDTDGTFGVIASNLSGFSVDAYGRVVGTPAREAFLNLGAGKYWLVASTNDDNQNFADTQMQIQFTVAKHSNYWNTTPSILQWTWNEYNPELNVISGAARYSDSGIVYYGIYSKQTCQTSETLIGEFTLDENGLVPEKVANALDGFSAGTYWLKGRTADNSANYDNCEGIVPFTVQMAQNSWTVSPYVVSWQYGEYDRNFNLIKGEAKFDAVTLFTVYTDAACTKPIELSQEYDGDNTVFVLGSDGLVPGYVKDALYSLDKGIYYLVAKVESTSDYYGINDGENIEPVPFEVTALDNYWTEAPGLLSWSEGHFSAFDIDGNLSGKAKLGDVKFTIKDDHGNVLFIIYTQGDRVSSVYKPNGTEAKVSDLNSLSVGAYEITAEVEEGGNYSGLVCTASFAVFEDSVGLNGIIAATVVFAIIDIGAAGFCIALIIIRRKKVEEQLRNMIKKELHRR